MPPKNLNIILLAVSISLLCYLTHRRARTAMMVGDALDLINNFYVDPVDRDDLLTAAMNGMTGQLDEHSSFIPGDAYESFQDSINQEFAGIGIFVEQPDPEQPVRVITPLVGSPALQAGVLPADEIIQVDGEDVSKMSLRDVSTRLKGPVGTNVNLLVRREAGEFPLSVGRATIELESVIGDHRDQQNRWVYRLADHPEIAYVRLTSFGEKTVAELRAVLEELNNDFAALILDVRGNSGGLLYAARDICDMFLDSGRIVSTRVRGGRIEEVYNANPGVLIDTPKPMAILIDGESASASEIVAAALQDNQRAVVVGTRSFGKGTVQNILPLQFGRSALRLTVARYFRPSEKSIHRLEGATEEDDWGVIPDEGLAAEIDEQTLLRLTKRWQEASYPLLAAPAIDDPETPADEDDPVVDPQLQRAIEYLLPQAGMGDPAAGDGQTDAATEENPAESLQPAA
jgi:carboxyl-terminal processing protease